MANHPLFETSHAFVPSQTRKHRGPESPWIHVIPNFHHVVWAGLAPTLWVTVARGSETF